MERAQLGSKYENPMETSTFVAARAVGHDYAEERTRSLQDQYTAQAQTLECEGTAEPIDTNTFHRTREQESTDGGKPSKKHKQGHEAPPDRKSKYTRAMRGYDHDK